MVDLGGYVIILTQNKGGKIKLYGSPADRPNCDEVLEINGRTLNDANHQDIIQYIHQCIQTKTICLRVKRRSPGKLAPDCTLIDAFVIGARAREHLAKIAKDTDITPRDIAQLSRILGDSTDGSPNKDHINVASRVTSASAAVTSVLSSSITSASSAPNVHHPSCCTNNSKSGNINVLPGVDSSLHDDSLSPCTSSSYPSQQSQRCIHPPLAPGHLHQQQQQIQYAPQLHHPHLSHHPHHLPHTVQLTGERENAKLAASSNIHHHPQSHQILRHQYSGDSVVASSAAISSSVRKVRLSATSSSPAAVVPVTCASSPPASTVDAPLTSDSSIVDDNRTNTAIVDNSNIRSLYHPYSHGALVEQKILRRTTSRPDSTDGAEIEYYELQTTSSTGSTSNAFNTIDTMNEMPNLYSQQQSSKTQQCVTTGVSNNNMRQQNVTKIPIGGATGPSSSTHYVPSSSASASSVPTSSSPASSSSSQPSSSSAAPVSSSVIVIGNSASSQQQQQSLHHYPSYQNANVSHHQQQQLSNVNVSRNVTCNVEHEMNSDAHVSTSSHRELPVDVPDSFVGVVKTAPRYPPPASMRSSSLNQSTCTNVHQLPLHSTIATPSVTSGGSTIVDIDRMRLAKYSDEMKIKRDTVDGRDDSLRSSLRDSKKLMKLENHDQQSAGHLNHKVNNVSTARVNAAYEPDEDQLLTNKLDTQVDHVVSPSAINDLPALVTQVSNQVSDGDLKNALEQCRLSKLLSVYSAVMNSNCQSRQICALLASPNASTELVQDIIAMLQDDCSRNAEVAELLEILTRFELEGVCYAFDQIVLSKRQQQRAAPSSQATPSICTMSAGNNVTAANMTSCGAKKVDESIASTAISSVNNSAPSAHVDSGGNGNAGVHHASSSINAGNGASAGQSLVSAVRSPAPYDPLTEAQMKESQVLADMSFDPYVKVVRIEKSTCDPLGATVRNEPDGSVIIGRIVKGGAAEKCGLLKEGDEILEVNGIEMKGRNVNQVCEILQEMTGMLTFVIAQRSTSALAIDDTMIAVDGANIANPLISGNKMAGGMMTSGVNSAPIAPPHVPCTGQTQIIHVKAQFDYDPAIDLYIPCRELGICFCKGDILHVIDQSDCNWWQAYREGETAGLAGLIPSISFQLQREAMRQSVLTDTSNKSNNNNNNNNSLSTGILNNNNNNNNIINSTRTLNYKNSSSISDRAGGKKKSSSSSTSSLMLLNCGKRSHEKRKKRRSLVTIGSSQEILTYEEVALYYPRANIKRPIVLIGPTSIGRQYLRTRLMKDRERFEAAVPHTSRSIKSDGSEVDGIDYHFITRAAFEQGIREGRFVEHGEFEKNYYGTSLEAIEAVVQSGKICVLNLHVHSINILRSGSTGGKLKPYFVFVSPPPQIEKLNRLINAVALAIDKESNVDSHRHHTSSSSTSTSSLHQHHSTHHSHSHRQLSPSELQAIIDEGREIDARYGHYFDMILNVTDIEKAYNDLLNEINLLERDPQWIPLHWLKQ